MIKNILIFIILFTAPAYANKEEDKAEFKSLYAEFNDLYANSEAIDPIIEVAEKLYKIAPKAFGKKSKNNAVVIYNLASLYDEKGARSSSRDEKKALGLYEEYFRLLYDLGTPKDKAYLEQYQAFMQTHYNVKKKKSEDLITDTALEIAYSLNLTDLEIANVEYTVGLVRILNRKLENTDSHFSNALKLFTNEYGSSHSLVGEIEYWLAMLDLEKREYVRASDRFEKVVAIFSDGRPDASGFLKNSHLYLIKLYYVQEKSAFESDHFTEYLRLEHNWIPRDNIKDNPDEYLPTVRANPYYPARAAENGIEGFVIVKFTVDTNGDTKDVISILSSDEMFERNSIKAASKYKYKPRMVDGEAVEVTDVIVRIEFKLEG